MAIDLFKTHITEGAVDAVAEVLRSGWVGQGPKVDYFEEEFAAYVGASYAISTNSASAALHMTLLAHGFPKGSEVLTTSLTFVSTNHAILHAGYEPVFVDIDETLNMDLHKAAEMVGPKTRAIMAVHYSGNTFDLNRLYVFARTHKLEVIQDAAHACGSRFEGKPIGNCGTACFSFHAVKNLPMGDGGMVTTDDQDLAEEIKKLRWSGVDRSTYERSGRAYQWEYNVDSVGFKFQMNDINAAIGIEHLKHLDEWNYRRRELRDRYDKNLNGHHVEFPADTIGSETSGHLYVVKVDWRNKLVDDLREVGISTGVHYKPNHHYPMFKNCRTWESNWDGTTNYPEVLPETENAYRHIISLPMHLGLSKDDVDFVCDKIIERV